jgi:hypothetical protein
MLAGPWLVGTVIVLDVVVVVVVATVVLVRAPVVPTPLVPVRAVLLGVVALEPPPHAPTVTPITAATDAASICVGSFRVPRMSFTFVGSPDGPEWIRLRAMRRRGRGGTYARLSCSGRAARLGAALIVAPAASPGMICAR